MSSTEEYTLPPLPYAYDALESHISTQIMTLHHSKHHQTYVTNLNKALAADASFTSLTSIPARIANQAAIKFNGGGHINRSLFWENLAPAGSSATDAANSAPKLMAAIETQYGGLEKFKEKFGAALLGIQGSGWGWLVKSVEGDGRLSIVTTKDQDPVAADVVPVLGVDMWEHAYYLQYLNGKPAYVENIWKVVNRKEAEKRFEGGRKEAFEVLKGKI